MPCPTPDHGEHTEEVLEELEMNWDEIIRHMLTGAVK
jgi:crotonobetainyl-CoA:carnitine CoA-transferase CaiB-like acyl-CoA transferase